MKKRKDGRYISRLTLSGGDKIDIYGKTQKEVKEKIEDIKFKHAMGILVVKNKATVSEWSKIWWETDKKGKTSPSSQQGYLNALNNYILPEFGQLKVTDVRTFHCQQLLNSMTEKSQSLQKQVKITLNGMFRYAVINGLIMGNPAQYIKFSVAPDKAREALQPKEVKELLEKVKGKRAELLVHLGLYCGLRRGEIIGLMWNDLEFGIDSEGNEIGMLHIHRSVQIVSNQSEIKDPKSKAGFRSIPIPLHLLALLKETPKSSLYVVPSAKNKRMSLSAFTRLWEPVQDSISYNIVFHQLRHTYATNLHKLGIDPKMMQYLLGHAKIDMTLETYTDIQDQQLEATQKKISNLYLVSHKSVKTA